MLAPGKPQIDSDRPHSEMAALLRPTSSRRR